MAMHTPATLKSGSTAVVVLMRRGNTADDPTTLYCANVGDSKAVLCRSGVAVEMSYDHKPSRADERQRIIDAGGTVITNRLYGVLGVSRSFGDLRFKNQMVRVSHMFVCLCVLVSACECLCVCLCVCLCTSPPC
jgi:protein phosphatase PTC1